MEINNRPVDIIIPVYSGVDETIGCINSVCDSLQYLKTVTNVVVIFDAGPDVELREQLSDFASQGKITLLINEQNQGFIRTVNRGIQRSDRDVLLLNSDTLVANDWLDRIVSRAYSRTTIATVTPFSNNAEICSWPVFCEVNTLYKSASVEEIDRAFAELSPEPVDIPTAVGFCMFIKRECINRVGVFDFETFGRGYGEENDFCMRASALNFTHILATDVYVYHHGGVSFGDEKKALVQEAINKLDKKYPHYSPLVAKHIASDPARKWRYAAELVLQCQRQLPLVLHISHDLGGGTDKHVVELANYTGDGLQHAIIVPQTDCMRMVFPNVINEGLFDIPYHQMGALKTLLFALSLNRIHIHHVIGWEDHVEELLNLLNVPFDITLHDYYFLHVNPALADSQGYFCEDQSIRDEVCADVSEFAFPEDMDGNEWRGKWASLLNTAERVIAPCNMVASLYNEYHPELSITCAYHPDHEMLEAYPAVQLRPLGEGEALRVVVLGGLSRIKGADVLESVSELAAETEAALEFTLLGFGYKEFSNSVTTLGEYIDADLPDLLEQLEPHLIWFPCTWPETYSYTLSAALEAGLPVVCPNLGSFPERVQNRPFTWLEQWDSKPEQRLHRLLAIRASFGERAQHQIWQDQPQSLFSYSRSYKHPGLAPDVNHISSEELMEYWLSEPPVEEEVIVEKTRFYRVLAWFNSHRFFGLLANLIPMWMRQAVKTKLSDPPLRE
ncbi:MAG: glycosyltransferase [Gammaproteobacteria bacterium]|nr:glycosyltransferase [Gammaproteobacteria bacterium]